MTQPLSNTTTAREGSATRRASLRRPYTLERLLLSALAATAVGLVGLYVIGLGYLLLRGGMRVVTFTSLPTPELGISGERTVRAVYAAAFGACLGMATTALARAGAASGWLGRLSAKARHGLATFVESKQAQWVPVAFALGAALLLRNHLPRFLISLPSETRSGGGIAPELFNTVYFAILSTAVTAPIGVGAALYLAKLARSGPFTNAVRIALDTLASLPSIVYGLFGFLVFVVAMNTGYSLLAGAAVLAMLNLPLVVGVAEESIRAVPRELEDASFALGATKVQTAFRVSLPHAWPGILSAIVLSVGRVFAESAPLIMTAGTTISRGNAFSLNPLRGGETLAVHLWYVNSVGLTPDRAEVSAGTAAVLVVLVALSNVVASRLSELGGERIGRRQRQPVRA